jgi:hypothetical protein
MRSTAKRNNCWETFHADEEGAELIEWMLLTLIIGLAGAGVLALVRDELSGTIERVLGGFLGW